MKRRLILLGSILTFVLFFSFVSASNIVSSTYNIGSYTQGVAGGTASSSLYSARSFTGYEQPGGTASSSLYSANIGFPPTGQYYIAPPSTKTTTTSPSSGGGSGGGGGGTTIGTTSALSLSSTFSTSLLTVNRSVSNVVNVTNFTGDITSVSFITKQNLNNVNISLTQTQAPSKQSLQISSPGSVYQGFSVNLTGMNDSDLSQVTIHFRVSKNWVSSNNINFSTISLYRNPETVGSTWTKLSTSLDNSDSQYYYFTALSPGFSRYAIFGASLNMTSSNNPSQNQAKSNNFFTNITPTFFRNTLGYIIYYFLLILIILGIVAVSYSLYKRTLGIQAHNIWKKANEKNSFRR